MKQTKKTLLVIICISMITAMTSCSRRNATGCPTFAKFKQEQSAKKSI